MTTLPGWTTKVDEISNGVFKVTLTDSFGRKAEIIDNATDDTIQRTYQDAFEIEKQVSTNWKQVSLRLMPFATFRTQQLRVTVITTRILVLG